MRTYVALFIWLGAAAAYGQVDQNGPREMLRVMQIDDSLLSQFVDDRPVENNEEEPLLRLLFRMPSFSMVDLDTWTKPIEDIDRVLQNVEQNRFLFFETNGVVSKIETQTVLPELVQRMGFAEYYKLWISSTTKENSGISVVYTRSLPDAWQGVPLAELQGQYVRAQSMLLKTTDVGGQRLPVFVSPHIGWYPRQSTENDAAGGLHVSEDLVLLSGLGVDAGRLTSLAHRTGMKGVDRESFYQMLAAVQHVEPSKFAKLGRKDFDIARLIQRPQEAVGELYTIRGLARRAQLIRVDDRDVLKRFGLYQYWEIEVFVEMEKPVRFVDEESGETRRFRDYPFVICVPQIPQNMAFGEDIRVPIEFSGFFFKLWAYRTEFMAGMPTQSETSAKQLSPLFIGPTVLARGGTTESESHLSLIIACLFIGCLALLWVLLWRANISDRRQAKKLFEKNRPPDGSVGDLAENGER